MNIRGTLETIKSFEESLQRYRTDLSNHPGSLFYTGLVKNTEEYIEELKEELKSGKGKDKNAAELQKKTKLINEATSTDIKIINLLQSLGWKAGDTLLYQQEYKLTAEHQAQYSGIKSIKPDIVLQDLNGEILAVIENKLEYEKKGLKKLR